MNKFIGNGIARITGKKGRWVTLGIWVLIIAILSLAWPSVNKVEDNSAFQLPSDAMSVQAAKIAKEQFPDDAGNPVLITWYRGNGLTNKDFETVKKTYNRLEKQPIDDQSFIPPFSKMPPESIKSSVSKDGTALVTPVFINKNAGINQLQEDIDQLNRSISRFTGKHAFSDKLDTGSLHVRLTGPVGIQTDAVSLFSQADVALLIATVLLVLILLIVLYRSPLLAIVPLIGVGFAYGVISPILGLMGDKGWITIDTQSVSIMTVLLFGAGTDYCLFLVSRYREELFEEQDKFKALESAIKHSGGAILMSALTVVLGLSTLLLAHYGSYHRFAVPFSLAVLIMGLAALTLLPAILAIFGRVSFFPFIPRTKEMTKALAEKKGKTIKQRKAHGSASGFLGRIVTRRPWTIIIASVIVLGVLASFSAKINYTYDLLESFPKDMPSREGFDIIAEHFSAGELAPVQVIVDSHREDLDLKEKLEALPFVKSVSKAQRGKTDKDILSFDINLAQNPYTAKSIDLIPKIKNTTASVLSHAGIASPDRNLWIGGETANLYDTKTVTDRDAKVIVPIVILIIALLLLFYLRSVIAMIYLILTVLLSYFSALGTGWLLLHYGMGVSAIQGLIPLYSFVFLVALGEDYNIFMISDIWKNGKTQPMKTAVANGVSKTTSVITSAGLILAGTFAVLATLPIQVLVQFGIVTAIGVLLDTFVVRPLLVPAITTVLGRYAFWPGRLWKDTSKKENYSKEI
ncbi:RND superfamily putative drug exporter/hypothetical protein [Scopulibacillus darangshiensis]|uniref:SSD domain-containing protein n=1 Tax=Scopulibacillus darangshiensis TaxID=442528 RepID=A0A4R2P4I7_9BACL|nr:MMPL family transporter [Scopulibacillus darangshiensis]TCP29730.1 RND superfamily putative drug exporter/hypothetical protein [Scopulibacillus darangshiensis]